MNLEINNVGEKKIFGKYFWRKLKILVFRETKIKQMDI